MRGNCVMQIGYMRISKGEQTTALQEDALAKAAVERTYRDVMSGVRDDRPQFQAMLDFARPGDTIVVWRLDRLSSSLFYHGAQKMWQDTLSRWYSRSQEKPPR